MVVSLFRFKLRNPTDAGALKEAALYVTMLLTEVNAIYRTVSDSTAGQMELVVFGVKLLYPAGSQEWPFLSSTAGVLQTTESCGTGCIPLLTTLKTFLDNHWASLPQFDHLAFLSGYDIANAAGSGLLGIAYSNTVCEQDGYRSYKISVTEDFKHDAVFIFAHELGHALGARHDGFDTAIACPPSGYIMAAYAENPTAASENTFWTFSNCSVNGFVSHLTAMRDAGRDCLSSGSTNATDEAFRSQFCSGPRGARYSLDEQCFYESSATKYAFDANCNPLPTRPDGVTKMAPINACWDDRLVACSSQNTPGTCNDTASNGTAIFHVADGTPCQGSDPNLDYVCFNGDCLLTPDVCSGWNSTSSVPTGDIYPCACTNLTDTDRATCCSFKPIRPCCNGCRTVGKRCVA
ncbi:hypothetical protein DPMN_123764 [Dreissena polymorpha]|uniref:Peptidase M12B domain-containing protein n=1 Tax=Dreissena polymorpha TaxID=45954 RepID=A0A9D4GRY8_DREPO|nr:hypothetical protein DPMN_123764 [Dreissena polymorpha]